MRHSLIAVLLMPVLAFVVMPASAASPFIEAHGGSLGLGLEAGIDFGKWRLRAQSNDYRYEHTDAYDGIDYKVNLDLTSTGAIVDLVPFAGGFYLSAGVFDNGTAISGISEQTDVQVGAAVVSGQVLTDVTFAQESLYVGGGWRFGGRKDKAGIGVNLDVGAYMNGAADVDLTTTNAAFNQSNKEDIAQEEQQIEDDLEELEVVPVVKLGLAWYF